jgi:hypothetical protein
VHDAGPRAAFGRSFAGSIRGDGRSGRGRRVGRRHRRERLVNAREAMAKGGTITIRGFQSGASVGVAFEDDGPGIPPENLERIFEPFFTTKGAHGTGVGLAMAKEVLEKFGGSIRAQNLPSGGASFELRFVARACSGFHHPTNVRVQAST